MLLLLLRRLLAENLCAHIPDVLASPLDPALLCALVHFERRLQVVRYKERWTLACAVVRGVQGARARTALEDRGEVVRNLHDLMSAINPRLLSLRCPPRSLQTGDGERSGIPLDQTVRVPRRICPVVSTLA